MAGRAEVFGGSTVDYGRTIPELRRVGRRDVIDLALRRLLHLLQSERHRRLRSFQGRRRGAHLDVAFGRGRLERNRAAALCRGRSVVGCCRHSYDRADESRAAQYNPGNQRLVKTNSLRMWQPLLSFFAEPSRQRKQVALPEEPIKDSD